MEDKICYICHQSITQSESYFYIGKDKEGNKLYRHDDKEHEQMIIDTFVLKMAEIRMKAA